MIIPIHLDVCQNNIIRVNDSIILVNEKNRVVAFDSSDFRIGLLSQITINNKHFSRNFEKPFLKGKVWGIFKNKILVELSDI